MFSLFKNKISKTPFMPLYERITRQIQAGQLLTSDGNKFTKQTGYNYKTGATRFRQWEKENGTIFLEEITIKWAESFAIFLMSKGYTKNTIAVTLARLKAVLRRLYNEGLTLFNGSGIKAPSENITTVYNTLDEIKLLLETDFSETPGLSRVRDVYILQSFIGSHTSPPNPYGACFF